MADLEAVRALYEAYLEKAEQLERDRKPGEGIFGLKGGPADDPCHGRFAADLEAMLGEYVGDARDVLEYIWFRPDKHRDPRSAYWMLLAVHGLTLPLVNRLTREEAAEFLSRYGKTYPRWERLPVQNKTLEALKARQR